MEFGNLTKTRGVIFAQVVNYLKPKVKDIAILLRKFPFFSRSWIGLPIQFYVCTIVTNYGNWHRENLRLDRVNAGNLKIQFAWVP